MIRWRISLSTISGSTDTSTRVVEIGSTCSARSSSAVAGIGGKAVRGTAGVGASSSGYCDSVGANSGA